MAVTNKVQCSGCGKFYDGNRYPVCPFCAKENPVYMPNNSEIEKKQSNDFIPNPSEKRIEINNAEEDRPVEGEKTYGAYDGVGYPREKYEKAEITETGDNSVDSIPTPGKDEVTDQFIVERKTGKDESFEAEVKEATARTDGKTFGYFGRKTPSQGIEVSAPATHTETVAPFEAAPTYATGLLACIKGPFQGKTFFINSGKNSIGRSDNNAIVIKDQRISREKHAFITYEPKKREFFISSGDSSGLVYLNDENVMDSTRIKEGDMLELGDCIFYFKPICDEKFSWDMFEE